MNVKNVTDNKEFWKTVKPFLSDEGNSSSKLTLVEDDDIISEDQDVVQKLNDFFSNSVKFLEIPKIYSYLTNPIDHLTDSSQYKISCLDTKKSNTFNSIPITSLI